MKHTYKIPVVFEGMVEVTVDDSVPADHRLLLAEKMAICKVIATVDNPDSLDDDALDEYAHHFGVTDDEEAIRQWTAASANSVGGSWGIATQAAMQPVISH